MKRFFKWLLTIFRPESKNYVRNIQEGKDSKSSESAYSGSKRKRSYQAVLAWSHQSDIASIEKDKKGVFVEIRMKLEKGFQVLALNETPVVSSRKKGLSAVAHSLEFTVDTEDESTRLLIEQAQSKKPLCFLYRSVYGDVVLLGEESGLEMTEYDGSKIKFSGEETDVFFHVAEECLVKLLPNIEK